MLEGRLEHMVRERLRLNQAAVKARAALLATPAGRRLHEAELAQFKRELKRKQRR